LKPTIESGAGVEVAVGAGVNVGGGGVSVGKTSGLLTPQAVNQIISPKNKVMRTTYGPESKSEGISSNIPL
jgi:hypothetical protein